jgi:UDPglucose 6-dehydrogenase
MNYNITIIGSGYVGLVTGACLADIGHNVTCVDVDEAKVAALKNGDVPIYEPGLAEVIKRSGSRLKFTSKLELGDVVFLAVGTPTDETTGNANMSAFFAAAKAVAAAITKQIIVITKSTVPLGTGKKLEEIFAGKAHIVSNPEFLREGSAVADFMHPDRIVIGTNSQDAAKLVADIYAPLKAPIHHTSLASAELIKYAANTFLAAKVVFINEMADICEASGADIEQVATGMGLDKRIGQQFLKPGPGIGGSCFPKDSRALAVQAAALGKPSKIIEGLIAANEERKTAIAKRIIAQVKTGKVAIFGLAFKANTDDVRESAALSIIPQLQKAGLKVVAYDPKAKWDGVENAPSAAAAAKSADLIVILTEWDEFKTLNYEALDPNQRVIMDFRNILKSNPPKGYNYYSIGTNV